MAFWDTVLSSADAKLYGKRLIPTIVDNNARQRPERICFSFPVCSTNLHHGFRDVNWLCFANAINRMAYFLQSQIGRSSVFQTVMYMGFPDIRTFIILVAAMKTGHKVLFSSHRNSLAGHANLIEQTDCTVLLHTAGFPVLGILERCRLKAVQVPELASLLDDALCEPYPFDKTFNEAKYDPCFVIHTLGTTDQHHIVAPLDGRPSVWGTVFDARRRNYLAWPISLNSGIAAGITDICFNNITTVFGPPEEATAQIMNEMIQYADIDSASCTPATLEELAQSPDVLAKLNVLKHIAYIGGSLSQHAGEVVSRYVPLVCLVASTETVTMVQHVTDNEDWSYVCINPVLNGIEMRQVADLFELVYVRNSTYADFQGVFKVFPNLQEYSMRDLYSRHPTKPHHWKHEGRKDNIVVFRNGSKFNPMLHELMIAMHLKVQACVLVGTGRDKPAAIIELQSQYYTENVLAQQALKKEIWPQASRANDVADTYGQLEPRYVIFAKKEKPFARGPNGTVQRNSTVRLYTQEIEELYTSIAIGGLSTLFRTEASMA